jgi:hypothetical protein
MKQHAYGGKDKNKDDHASIMAPISIKNTVVA